MLPRITRRLGPHYVLAMMALTRVLGGSCGGLVVLYVNITSPLPAAMRDRFEYAASTVVGMTMVITILMALWGTRSLRRALGKLQRDEPLTPREEERAGREAVLFPGRQHLWESIWVPCTSCLPLCLYLWFFENASLGVIVQVIIAAFMGISLALMTAYFASERWMGTVVRYLLDRGVHIDFASLPVSRLRWKMNVCFSLTLVVAVLMIGALANRRAQDIITEPERQAEAVKNLREHTFYIVVAAIGVGFVLSRLLANSMGARVKTLTEAMQRVRSGSLTERVVPTGNDEIDQLARQFNAMVEHLAQNNQTIRDLNANLENKVKRRTQQLSKSKKSLQRSLRKLQENDRLKTEFFSNVSHELRTPLTMILTPLERIMEKHRGRLQPDVVTMLEVVCLHGHRLLELINRLLDFSKLRAGHLKLQVGAVNLNGLATSLIASARPLAEERGIRLAVLCDPALPVFGADEDKLDTVLTNLLSNAMKFTPSGGEVKLEIRRDGGMARVTVTDTGIGIAEEDQLRVFERFVQVDGSSQRGFAGTGLGLALAKDLIELHGGRIGVHSELGHGATFWFEMPLVDPPAELTAVETPSLQLKSRFADLQACELTPVLQTAEGKVLSADAARILIADDTPEIRALLAEILSDDYQVIVAEDGQRGWELAQRERPDLIISDVMMPRVDGQEFCRRVKADKSLAATPFILLTAKAELAMKLQGLDVGADDYLVKPFDRRELQARVRSLLKLRRLHHEIEARNLELERTLMELRSTQSQLIQSEKMSSLGQLVAGIAHEINNSINAVYNGIRPLSARTRKLENLLRDAPLGDEPSGAALRVEIDSAFKKVFMLAEVVEQGATRTARIVGDLKTFSHPGGETSESFDLNASLDVCLNLLFNQLKHRVDVQRDYGEVQAVYGPAGALNQVFMNILQNAQQAIPDKGTIFITTRQDGDSVRLSIRDTGLGIPEDIRDKIFDPFFTTKAPGVGTGLGLSLSYAILQRAGGRIECHSEVGVGTEFVLVFPRVCKQVEQAAAPALPLGPMNQTAHEVLA